MSFVKIASHGLIGYRSDLLPASGIRHIFTTRKNGVSFGEKKELNLGLSCSPAAEVRENFRRVCDAYGFFYQNLVLANQTHHDIIKIVGWEDSGNGLSRENRFASADALITNCRDLPLAVFFADCVPVLLADPVKKVIAACHSGWRGTVLEIAAKTVHKMQDAFGCDPAKIRAAIGPCLCQAHFETSEEVFKALCLGERQQFAIQKGEKYLIDLKLLNRYLLEHAGVKSEYIDVSDLCGVCSNDLFFSHRKEQGKTGRLAAVIQLEDA